MTITESDLREILSRESEDGLHRGVTVADVDRRVRRIKRRRLRALGGAVAAGLAVAAAFTLPGGGTVAVPDDIWTGVMAQPSPRYGARAITDTIMVKRFSAMGERVAFDLPERRREWMSSVIVYCPFQSEVLYWEDGVYHTARPCTDGVVEETKEGERVSVVGLPDVDSDTRRLEVAVVPPGSIKKLGRALIDDRDARQVVRDAGKSRADMRIVIMATRYEPCDSGTDCRFADESSARPGPASGGG
ncbi:hypothetical protein [Streptosporangium sp. NPDC000396]|uniref:hypothetical protein n=1 Tax=Streptosporangium sp. NPDC000396 TaxID=3366185 RepID=UPI0036887986